MSGWLSLFGMSNIYDFAIFDSFGVLQCFVREVLSWFFFFFSSRRRHTRYWRDWSSDVCSSDLPARCCSPWTPPRRSRPTCPPGTGWPSSTCSATRSCGGTSSAGWRCRASTSACCWQRPGRTSPPRTSRAEGRTRTSAEEGDEAVLWIRRRGNRHGRAESWPAGPVVDQRGRRPEERGGQSRGHPASRPAGRRDVPAVEAQFDRAPAGGCGGAGVRRPRQDGEQAVGPVLGHGHGVEGGSVGGGSGGQTAE